MQHTSHFAGGGFQWKVGAELLVAMAGPMVGYQVEYWMDIKPTKIADVEGQEGYATKTTEITLGGQKAFVMTLQKGECRQGHPGRRQRRRRRQNPHV